MYKVVPFDGPVAKILAASIHFLEVTHFDLLIMAVSGKGSVYILAAPLDPVADPGFPRGGGANSPGGRQHTILPKFPKNCMKLKEFGPPGGRASKILLCRPLTPLHPGRVLCSVWSLFHGHGHLVLSYSIR